MKTEAQKDSFFNPERRCASDAAKLWIASLMTQIEDFETASGIRQRKRKAVDQALFAEQVEALVSDAAYTHLHQSKGKSGKVTVSLSRTNMGPKQDGHRLVNSVLGRTLELLSADGLGLLVVIKGSQLSGRQTTFEPSRRLKARVRALGFKTSDFCVLKERPLIELRARKKDKRVGKRLPIDSADPEVQRMAQELKRINEAYESTQIDYHGSNPAIDDRERKVYRIFNESLRENGLIYGGFWSELTKPDRLDNLYIEDEPIEELDLKSAALQIAYALVGYQRDIEQLYRVPELKLLSRDYIKKTTLTLLNGGSEAFKYALPKKVFRALCSYQDEDETRVRSRMLRAIRDYHRPIAEYFDTSKARYLTYIQGEIIVDAVLALLDKGIIALPVGDAIYVKESVRAEALQALDKSFRKKTGSKRKIVVGL